MTVGFHAIGFGAIATGPAPGPSTSWVAVVFLTFMVAALLRRILRRRSYAASQTPVAPNHPVILPSHRVVPKPDQAINPTLPIESVRELLGSPPRAFAEDLGKYLRTRRRPG